MKDLTIHAYFLCYNEEYILPHLLKYYSKFCDKIYILDNNSSDNSIQIINSFDNTEIITWDSNNEVRDDLYLKLKNNVWKQSIGEGYHMIGDENLVLKPDDDLFSEVKEGIKGESNDKLMLFDCNKVKEINYMHGCHIANPIGDIKMYRGSDLKMLHFKYLGLDDFIPKQKLRGDRLSEFNKTRGLGMYYLYSEEKHREEYKTFINRRKKVL